jgi:hypothetical protein
MAVEGLDQGYRAFEQRHDDRGVHVEGKRRRREQRRGDYTFDQVPFCISTAFSLPDAGRRGDDPAIDALASPRSLLKVAGSNRV